METITTLATITDEVFEQARDTWRRKIEDFAFRSTVPFMDDGDIRQEMELVLYKCLQRYDPTRKVKFHTYLHTAMHNRIRKLYSPFGMKNDRLPRSVHPDWLVYLGDDSMVEADGDRAALLGKLVETLEPSLAFQIEDYGFEGNERTWLEGRCYGLNRKETARLQGIPEQMVKEGCVKAKIKIQKLIEERGKEDGPD